MNHPSAGIGDLRTAEGGFTLLSVLVSIFVLCFGLLGMVRSMVGVTAAATQNQTVTSLAALSNSFWSLVQWTAQPTVIGSFPGTYDLTSNTAIAAAPTNLQPWLQQAHSALPAGTASIMVNDSACTTNCQLMLTLSWQQIGAPGTPAAATRTQTFYFAL
jgi:type II secretory pathway pseudopilin PulG